MLNWLLFFFRSLRKYVCTSVCAPMWRQTNWCHSVGVVAAPTNIYWARYTEIVVVAMASATLTENFRTGNCNAGSQAFINFVDCIYMAMMSYISIAWCFCFFFHFQWHSFDPVM